MTMMTLLHYILSLISFNILYFYNFEYITKFKSTHEMILIFGIINLNKINCQLIYFDYY